MCVCVCVHVRVCSHLGLSAVRGVESDGPEPMMGRYVSSSPSSLPLIDGRASVCVRIIHVIERERERDTERESDTCM